MRWLVCAALLFGCREQNTEPPTGHEIKPPRSAARLAPEAGLAEPAAPPSGGVSQRMFADDVAADALPLSIRIETIGGVATAIIPRGTKLPTTHTEVFSTAMDDQNRVEVHLLQGERPLVSQNRSLGKFQLFGIPPAPRGVPQIEVTFAIDTAGVLSVSARDKATNRVQQIQIDSVAAGTLDKAAVDKMLAEAQAAAAQDQQAATFADTRLQLESLIYADRQLLKDVGNKLSRTTRTKLERELDGAEAVLKTATKPEQLKLVLAVKRSLGEAGHAAATELYANAK